MFYALVSYLVEFMVVHVSTIVLLRGAHELFLLYSRVKVLLPEQQPLTA